MVVALSYLIAIIITILLAIFLYPIAAFFWCLGLFGKISDMLFGFTQTVISALWKDIKNMDRTVSVPSVAQDNLWYCSCGCANSGKFCQECGNAKPQPNANSENSWVCECGAFNDMGKFCSVCGRPNPNIVFITETKMLED